MIVRKHMVDGPVSARPGDGLYDTYRRMRENDIRHMPVLDERERLVGIVSERDVLRPGFVDEDLDTSDSFVLDNSILVSQVMTPDPVTLHTEDPLNKALELFLKHKFGALPVLDSDEKLIGILSTIDLLKVLQDQLE